MKRKKRLLILFCFLIIFLLGSPLILFYVQGYRLDFEKKKISQTGGISIKTEPPNAKIYFNDKFKGETNIIFRSLTIQNLLPKEYKVRIEKKGYFNWEKVLKVEEKKFTKAEDIILFLQKINLFLLEENVEDFWFSPDKKTLILKEKNNSLDLKLIDFKKNISLIVLKEEKNYDLDNIYWSDDSKKIFFKVLKNKKSIYYLYNLEEKKLDSFDFKENIQNVFWDKYNPQIIYLESNGNLFLYSLTPPKKREKLIENCQAISFWQNSFFCFSKEGNLEKYSPKEKKQTKENKISKEIKNEAEYEMKIFPFQNIFLFEKNKKTKKVTVFYFNKNEGVFEVFLENQKSTDLFNQNFLFCTENEIWISDPYFNKTFITRLGENVNNCFWINLHYLIIQTPQNIKILETDTRDGLNIYDLGFRIEKNVFDVQKIKKMFFNSQERRIYFLLEKNLYYSEPLY